VRCIRTPTGAWHGDSRLDEGTHLEGDRQGAVHGYELAKRLGISLSSVYEHFRDLRESGLVEAAGRGRRRVYSLTEKGKHLMKALK